MKNKELLELIKLSIPNLEESKIAILYQLLLHWLGNIKKFHLPEIDIPNIQPFNDGKSGSLVFMLEIRIYGYSRNQKWVFKFDKELRIDKEIKNNSYLDTMHSDICPKWESIGYSIDGYSILPFTTIGSNSLDQVITVESLNSVIIKNIQVESISSEILKEVAGYINSSLDRIFSFLFYSYHKGTIKPTGNIPLNNLFDFILPPNLLVGIHFLNYQMQEVEFDWTDFEIDESVEIKNLILKEYEVGSDYIQLKFILADGMDEYRVDGKCPLEFQSVLQENLRYTIQGDVLQTRKSFFQKEASNWNLNPQNTIEDFRNPLDISFLKRQLKKPAEFYITDFLHYDLNPTNILLCQMSNRTYISFLIDFFESRKTGSIFYDVARLEIQTTINFYTQYFKLKYFENYPSQQDVPSELLHRFDKEVENTIHILQYRLSLYKELNQENFGLQEYIYSILYNIRKRASDYANEYLSSADFKKYEWYKNYLYTLGFFTVSYFKYSKEENVWIKKRIAYWIAGKLFYLANCDTSQFVRQFTVNFSLEPKKVLPEIQKTTQINTEYIVVCTNESLILLNKNNYKEPNKIIRLDFAELLKSFHSNLEYNQGIRSITYWNYQSSKVLFLGMTFGVALFDLEQKNIIQFYSIPKNKISSLCTNGFNSISLQKDSLFAAHSNYGLVRWKLEEQLKFNDSSEFISYDIQPFEKKYTRCLHSLHSGDGYFFVSNNYLYICKDPIFSLPKPISLMLSEKEQVVGIVQSDEDRFHIFTNLDKYILFSISTKNSQIISEGSGSIYSICNNKQSIVYSSKNKINIRKISDPQNYKDASYTTYPISLNLLFVKSNWDMQVGVDAKRNKIYIWEELNKEPFAIPFKNEYIMDVALVSLQ